MRLSEFRDDQDLALFLGMPVEELRQYANAPDQRDFYDALRIPKRRRKGAFRTVYRAKSAMLQRMHKSIAQAVTFAASFPDCVHGFVKRHSILTNARNHLGKRVLLHADVHEFFESIRLPLVVSALQALGCAKPVAEILGRLCTLNGFLPQGTHSSPVLANCACRHLDADLLMLAAAERCTYTRYADDIVFSGEQAPPESTIRDVLARYGFQLRDGRCRLQRRGRGQFVTGLSVSDSNGPRLPRRDKRRLRLELYYAARFGLDDHLSRTGQHGSPSGEYLRLDGQVRFMTSIEPTSAPRLRAQLAAVSARM